MRIISKDKDYYDGAVGFYSDNDVVYVRKKEVIQYSWGKPSPDQRIYETIREDTLKLLQLPELNTWPNFTSYASYSLLFFCGRVYVTLKYEEETFWSFDTFHQYLENKAKNSRFWKKERAKTDLETLEKRETKKRYFTAQPYCESTAKTIKPSYEVPVELFLKVGTPCFLIEISYGTQRCITLNPNLRKLGFASKLDSFTCYQELDMFLGNQMAQQKDPVPQRTDDLIRDQHGFNDKSFRNTAPSTKKERRKANKKRKRKPQE